jgi:hypothetical protein
MTKIYGNKNEHQPKNKHLFETVIAYRKQTKINHTIYFLTNQILKDKIKKTK